MGMFDWVSLKTAEEELFSCPFTKQDPNWQTKSLGCNMTVYRINGRSLEAIVIPKKIANKDSYLDNYTVLENPSKYNWKPTPWRGSMEIHITGISFEMWFGKDEKIIDVLPCFCKNKETTENCKYCPANQGKKP